MSTMTNEFKVRVAKALVQSNEVYKGEFKTVAELDKIPAYEGDYADVYETNTRWVFINGAWSNSEQMIPINPTLATKQDVNAVSGRVASIEQSITSIERSITSIEQVIAKPVLVIEKI